MLGEFNIGGVMYSKWTRVPVALAMVMGVLFALGTGSASAASAPITIALITSRTGTAAAEYATAPAGFLARIALQNAEGGINGHKIVPLVIDDQTSLTEDQTAVQDAISKKALGIVSVSPVFFSGAKFAQEAGIPVTGSFSDGPEWGEQPYTNMFASDNGSVNPKYPANTETSNFIKQHGGTVLGAYGYGISPSSTRAAEGTAVAFTHGGGKVGVLNTSIPFGGVAFTTEALAAKQAGVNAITADLDNNSNFALATSLEQAGVKPKVVVFPTGYEPSVINSPVWKTLQGDYFATEFRPFSVPDKGTEQMAAALEKYEHFTKSQFPTFGQYESWLGATLMIEGIQKAGKSPTHASVITALRSVKGYSGGGILPYSINYATIFGHDLPEECGWYMEAKPKGFVAVSNTPVCGKDIPGTATAG
jgi:branched-chain amino acid transport system substrate-binding protein